jgi:predicted TIM-barrel fold metal-dependent hydrolase
MSGSEPTVIDTHVHVWVPDYIPPALRMSWAEVAAYRKRGGVRSPDEIYPRVSQEIVDPNAEHVLAAMELAGVSKSIIMGVDYGPEDWAATRVPVGTIMRRYDEICRNSGGRLTFAAGVDPRRPDAASLARGYLASDACRGIKFYPPAGFRAYEEVCEPLYEALIETDKAAVFHTAAVRGKLAWRNGWPIYLADVQARHPELRIVLAHAGYSCWWDECVALAASHARTYLELSLWQDEALTPNSGFQQMLERAIRLCGSDRILFASDTMYGERLKGADRWKDWVAYFRALPEATEGRVSEDDVHNMLFCNAEEAFFSKS